LMSKSQPLQTDLSQNQENAKVAARLNGDEAENTKILKLKTPLRVGDGERVITELKLDCSNLKGSDFRRLCQEHRMRFNTSVPNLVYDEAFREAAIAKLNDIPIEDLDEIAFSDMVKATSRILYFFVE